VLDGGSITAATVPLAPARRHVASDRLPGRPKTEAQLAAFRCPDPTIQRLSLARLGGVVLGVFDDRVELRPAGDGVRTLAGPP
jgi:hypothetical protein